VVKAEKALVVKVERMTVRLNPRRTLFTTVQRTPSLSTVVVAHKTLLRTVPEEMVALASFSSTSPIWTQTSSRQAALSM
jgi:hypothetical protein